MSPTAADSAPGYFNELWTSTPVGVDSSP